MQQLFPSNAAVAELTAIYDRLPLPEPPSDRAYLYLNMVSSADGRAQVDGRSGGLGSPVDQALMLRLRARADCVLNGSGTASAEQVHRPLPAELIVQRRERGQPDEPLWALVTASGILPPTALSRPRRRPVVFVADATPPERRARLAERADVLTAGDERPEPCRVLRLLRERHNCYHVLCEGGPRLNYSVLRAGALDELFLTFAPKLAAGGGKGILDGPQLPKDAFLRLRLISLFEHESELFFRYQAVRG